MDHRNLTLLSDLYELTMMQVYFKEKDANETVIFDMFYRTNPHGNGFAICAGLEQAIEYIKGLHFDESDIEYLRSLNIFAEEYKISSTDNKFYFFNPFSDILSSVTLYRTIPESFFLTDMSVRTCRLLQSVPAPDADFYRSENRSGT